MEEQIERRMDANNIPNTPISAISGTLETPSEKDAYKEESSTTPTLEEWIEALSRAAEETLEEIPQNCKK